MGFRGRTGRAWFNLASKIPVDEFDETELPEEFCNTFEGSIRDFTCNHCNAYFWNNENKNTCCSGGKVKLPRLPPIPEQIQLLFDVNGSHFLKNARAYNNLFALASLGCGQEIKHQGFSPTFTVRGKIYHRIGSLLPQDGESPKFAQLYFHDTDHEIGNRMEIMSSLDQQTVEIIQDTLHDCNPYICSLKSGLELMRISPDVKLVLHADERRRPSDAHARTYNLPTASEVGVLLPGEITANMDVILHERGGAVRRISPVHRSYDPLHYVIMFPKGDDGFQLGMKRSDNRTLTASDFYCYRMQVRDDWNSVMKYRRLTQQYVCDMWAKIEGSRLDWVRHNQKTIKAEKYNGLIDAQADNDLNNAGKRIILPPSFYGSPRYYRERFQDSMGIVRKLGKPDLFVTFTCNPKWKEIQEALDPGESYTDRPDLCARVFKLKLNALLKDICLNKVFGDIRGYTATVEFQKRGLPHIHIVIILTDAFKPRTPEDVDKIVCAEIPDPQTNPRLHKIITTNNIHGPCGNINRNSPCMVGEGADKKCSKKFPKNLSADTMLTQHSPPVYRRRSPEDGGQVHRVNMGSESNPNFFLLDNSWVVPYSPLLSLIYEAHINVEVVYSTRCVKYLFKYINKGPDRVVAAFEQEDEVETYSNARYLSASEAYWRLYGFDLFHRSPAVMKLDCHLKGEQMQLFAEGEEEEAINRGPRVTKLLAYFSQNAEDPEAREVLYPDFPDKYTWIEKDKRWRKRKTGVTVGRIPVFSCNAKQSELFFLRMLLYNKSGATSFENLRTINGHVCPTFQEACRKLGLLETDEELDCVMEEASTVQFGNQLRDVFANLLIYCRPADPPLFWQRHREKLVEDFMRAENAEAPTELMFNQALLYLKERFEQDELDLVKDFLLPAVREDLLPRSNVPRVVRDETSYDREALAQSLQGRVDSLNDKQHLFYSAVMDSVANNTGKVFALQASGGTGKTYTINLILDTVRAQGKIALATALSGIAATLLNNGRTLHSRCKIPLKLTEDSMANFSKRDATGKLLQETAVLIIDEVSMGNKMIFETLDRSLQFVRGNNKLFGGITMVWATDWRQSLPVVVKGSRGQIVNSCLKSSYLWKHATVFKLDINMRVFQNSEDKEFTDYLLSCGDGLLPTHPQGGQFRVSIPEDLIFKGDLDALINWVFEDLETQYTDHSWTASRSLICPTNKTVDLINNKVMATFPGEERLYKSHDKVSSEDNFDIPQEGLFINNF